MSRETGREVPEKMGRRSGGGLRGALWLARNDLRRTWVSYPATFVAALFVGLLAISPVRGVLEVEGFGGGGARLQESFNGFLADFFFLCVCPALGINFVFNRDYGARYRQDNMSRRLTFLRGLAIPTGEIVAGRAITMLLAFVVLTPAFFLPLFLLSSRDAFAGLGVGEYWSFAAIWAGYTLLASGFYMYSWLGLTGREDFRGALGLLFGCALVALVANFVLGVHLVAGSIGLAREYGPYAALPALALGVTGFILWGLAATRRLRRRDL